MEEFPADVLLIIFSHFDYIELLTLSLVCKRFLSVCCNNILWHKLYQKYFIYTKPIKKENYKELFKKDFPVLKISEKQRADRLNRKIEANRYSTSLVELNISCVGDPNIGKTCLLVSWAHNSFLGFDYIPTMQEDSYTSFIFYSGKSIAVHLCDPGHSILNQLEATACPSALKNKDIILLCYSITNLQSLENAINVWTPFIRKFCLDIPIVLVGTKSGVRLRNYSLRKEEKAAVTIEQGLNAYKEIGAIAYVECGAYGAYNICKVFDECVEHFISNITNEQYVPEPRAPIYNEAEYDDDEFGDDLDE